MSSIREFIQSFFEASRERLRNPAIGTFILAWIAINWRFVAILFFSNSSLEERIKLIEECYLRPELTILYPLIVMGVYMLILPNLMALFDAVSQKAITYRKKIKNKNRLEDTIAKNKHRLEDVIAQQEIAAEERQLELIEEGSPDIAKLKEQIKKLEDEKNSLAKRVEPKPEVKSVESDSVSSTEAKPKTSRKKSTNTKNKSPELSKTNSVFLKSNEFPAMRDNVIRNVAKSEKEWILLYGFYAGSFGEREFTREDVIAAYDETKRKMTSRIKNVTNNINTLVKQGFVRFLNDNEMLLTESGKELVIEILSR